MATKNVGMTAGEAKRFLSMVVALTDLGEVKIRKTEGSTESIVVEVYSPDDRFVGSASVWINGPYVNDGACFAASEGLRPIVSNYYARHAPR